MILLLENILNRIGGIENSGIEFSKYSDSIEVILYDEKCNNILDNFLKNNSYFDEYDTIIIHESIYKSIYDIEERKHLFRRLELYAENKNKNLVKFSGDHSQSSLNNKVLELSAKNLYDNLEIFLKENQKASSDILMLAYGQHWDLNPLLNNLEKLNIFIENFNEKKKIRSAKFKKDFDLFKLKKILNEEEYQSLFTNLDFGYEVSIEEVETLAYNFKMLIQEKSNG